MQNHEKNREILRTTLRVTAVGMFINVALAVFKIAAGIFGRSSAVLADGIHTVSDLASDIVIIVGARYWLAPADREHPYGHGRVETLVTLALAGALAGTAIGLTAAALNALKNQQLPAPGVVPLCAAIASIICKELLYRWSRHHGENVRSPALIANAWHHRTDALSSIPAALAVLGARVAPQWAFLDPVGGIVVSILILHAGWQIGKKAMGSLIDQAAPPETVEWIRKQACGIQGVQEVHAIRTRQLGQGWSADLHLLVDGDMSVREGHNIAEALEERLTADPSPVLDAVVHVEPDEKSKRTGRKCDQCDNDKK